MILALIFIIWSIIMMNCYNTVIMDDITIADKCSMVLLIGAMWAILSAIIVMVVYIVACKLSKESKRDILNIRLMEERTKLIQSMNGRKAL